MINGGRRYNIEDDQDWEIEQMAYYLSCLALIDTKMKAKRPSILAAAS
mgnify:CR=1 FL=1